MTTEKTIISTEKYDDFVEALLGGSFYGHLKVLQEALDYQDQITQEYIKRTGYPKVFGIGETKQEAIKARNQLIYAIIKAIYKGVTRENQTMLTNHYSRLFHALTILKVKKSIIKKESKNAMYNIAYNLWMLDDGTNATYKFINEASWLMDEKIKEMNESATGL